MTFVDTAGPRGRGPSGPELLAFLLIFTLAIFTGLAPSLGCSGSGYRPALRAAIETSNLAAARLDLARGAYEARVRQGAIEAVARCEKQAAGDASLVGPCLDREREAYLARYQGAWEALSRAWVAQTAIAAALDAAIRCDHERDGCPSGACREQQDACVRASLSSAQTAAEALTTHLARAEEVTR